MHTDFFVIAVIGCDGDIAIQFRSSIELPTLKVELPTGMMKRNLLKSVSSKPGAGHSPLLTPWAFEVDRVGSVTPRTLPSY